jgi:hypothetical protein
MKGELRNHRDCSACRSAFKKSRTAEIHTHDINQGLSGMGQQLIERRRFKRIFFSEKDHVEALLSFLGNSDLVISTLVLDLGESGLRLTLDKDDPIGIRCEDTLLLREITGCPELLFLRNVRAKIRWVLDHQFLDHIGFGCEFLDMPSDQRERLRQVLAGDPAARPDHAAGGTKK